MAEGGRLDEPLLKNGNSGERPRVYEKLSIDNILSKYVGDFGRGQLVHFVIVSIAWCLEGLHTMVMIFADREPEWQCRSGTSCTPSSSLCSIGPSAWEWVGGKAVSTVSEWGLVCGEEYKVGLAQAAFFVGSLVGAGIFGHFSDSSAGRKGALFLACMGTGISGLITATAPNYWCYVAFRWVTGFMASGIGLSSFVLATEPVGPTKRGPVGMSAFYFFSLGIMALPFLASYSTSWRHLYVVTSLPALFYCATVLPTVWESPRWYVVQGRIAEAMDVLRDFATRNGKHIPEHVGLEIENQDEENQNVEAASGSLWTVMKNPATRPRMVIMVVIWFLTAVVYFGISLNVVNLGTNLYLGVFVNAIVEWPAFLLTAVLLERFGRRMMLVSTLLLSGLCCLGGSFLFEEADGGILDVLLSAETTPGALKVVRIVCSIVALFGVAGTYNLIYIYTSELFPTVVRNAALGLTTQAGGIGSIIAPVIVVTGRYNSAFPLGIFGIMAIIGAALSVGLPETLHRPIFETIEGLDKGEQAKANEILR